VAKVMYFASSKREEIVSFILTEPLGYENHHDPIEIWFFIREQLMKKVKWDDCKILVLEGKEIPTKIQKINNSMKFNFGGLTGGCYEFLWRFLRMNTSLI
jgi:hypothetical protein